MEGSIKMKLGEAEKSKVYRFGAGEEDNRLLVSGWGAPEKGFVWSEGKASIVTIPPLFGNNTISISLWGYVPAGAGAQELLIFINGLMKGYFKIHEKTIVRVSHSNDIGADGLELTLYIPAALSPNAAEGSEDHRELGVALSVIQVSSPVTQD